MNLLGDKTSQYFLLCWNSALLFKPQSMTLFQITELFLRTCFEAEGLFVGFIRVKTESLDVC